MHHRIAICVFASFLALCVTPALTRAQSATGNLSGTVSDQNNAVLAGAKVTAVNINTGAQRQVTTNEQGSFTIPLLPPSKYTVTVEQKGFAPTEIKNVELNVN